MFWSSAGPVNAMRQLPPYLPVSAAGLAAPAAAGVFVGAAAAGLVGSAAAFAGAVGASAGFAAVVGVGAGGEAQAAIAAPAEATPRTARKRRRLTMRRAMVALPS